MRILKVRFKYMARSATPTIQTTKDFILIKIPRTMFQGSVGHGKSSLERALAKSVQQAQRGEVQGPFSTTKDFLSALKKSAR